jgi:uncharacterized membrane protein YhfC
MLLPYAAVTIPDLNITTLMGVGLLCVFGPLILYLIFRKKLSLKFIPFLVGAACYMVFVLLIENQLSSLITGPGSSVYNAMISNPAMYMLYAGFSAGFIEEGGRYLVFYILKKWYSEYGTSVSVSLGYCSIESIFLVGVRFVVYSWLAIDHNSRILAGTSGINFPELYLTLSAATPLEYLAAGLERLLFTGIHIGLASLVWYSVTKPGTTYLFYSSVLLHAMFIAPAALKEVHVLNSTPLYYTCIAGIAVLSLSIAYFVYRADIRGRSKNSDPFSIF